jgi:hypothetical protein
MLPICSHVLRQEQKRNTMSSSTTGEAAMIRQLMEDMASLVALGLFTGMVTIWAQAVQGL